MRVRRGDRDTHSHAGDRRERETNPRQPNRGARPASRGSGPPDAGGNDARRIRGSGCGSPRIVLGVDPGVQHCLDELTRLSSAVGARDASLRSRVMAPLRCAEELGFAARMAGDAGDRRQITTRRDPRPVDQREPEFASVGVDPCPSPLMEPACPNYCADTAQGSFRILGCDQRQPGPQSAAEAAEEPWKYVGHIRTTGSGSPQATGTLRLFGNSCGRVECDCGWSATVV